MDAPIPPPAAGRRQRLRRGLGWLQDSPFASVRARFLLLVAAIFIVASLAAWFAVSRTLDAISRELGMRFAERQVALERETIRAPLLRETALTRLMAHAPVVLDWLEHEDDPRARAAALAELENYRQSFQEHSYFVVNERSRHYYFNDRDARFSGHELRETLDLAKPENAWYVHARTMQADYELNVDHNATLNTTRVWINAPARRGARLLGMVGTGLDLSNFITRFIDSETRGVTNIIVDEKGAIQAYRDRSRIALDSAGRTALGDRNSSVFEMLGFGAGDARLSTAMREAAANPQSVRTLVLDSRSGAGLESHSGARLLGVAYVPELHWFVMTEMDINQAIGRSPLQGVLTVLGVALAASLALVTLLLQRLVLRRVARLDEATRRVAQGDYELQLEPEAATHDEFARLASNFQGMANTVRDTLAHLETRVASRTRELSEVNRELASQRENLMASIRYARTIQSGLLPSSASLEDLLGPHWVIWQPRDEVSGDFYFAFESAEGLYVGIADCTGHGVPGALTSLIAFSVVKQVLLATVPSLTARPLADIMGRIDALLRETLHPNQAEAERYAPDHGMALGLCRFERGMGPGRLVFCGRDIDLYWQHGSHDGGDGVQIQRVAGERRGIGYRSARREGRFIEHSLELGTRDRLYLFTDGLFDHGGGSAGYGFGRHRVEAFLAETATLDLAAQGQALLEVIERYGEGRPRRDDLSALGFTAPATPGTRVDGGAPPPQVQS